MNAKLILASVNTKSPCNRINGKNNSNTAVRRRDLQMWKIWLTFQLQWYFCDTLYQGRSQVWAQSGQLKF